MEVQQSFHLRQRGVVAAALAATVTRSSQNDAIGRDFRD